MSNEPEKLSAQQSLEIITSMIRQAKGNIQKSSFHYLLWGWTILIANLGVYLLIKLTAVENPFLMFLITIPAAIISTVYGMVQGRHVTAPTILDRVSMWLWIGFGINCFILWIFGKQIGWNIGPVVITLCALPTLVSGIMLKFRPLMIGGVIFWVSGIILFMVDMETQFLVSAIAIAVGYLVPGYMLRRSEG